MEHGTVRVLIAAADALSREGLAAIFSGTEGVEVVCKVHDAASAAERVLELAPQVMVVAFTGTREERLRSAAMLAGLAPGARLVALIGTGEDAGAYITAGAAGVIERSASSAAFAAMARGTTEGLGLDGLTRDPDGLSTREGEVARLIARGYGNKDIAAQLRLSVKTVETYKARLMQKLGVATRAALVDRALQRGWLQAQ
jgi:DNA-binding NarL/FixJ family response regulator